MIFFYFSAKFLLLSAFSPMFIYMKHTKFHFVTIKPLAVLFITIILIVSAGCKTLTQPEPIHISRNLTDAGRLSARQLADFFVSQNPEKDYSVILNFAELYVSEAAMENINSDIAFAQMCLETGYLRFGGLVQPEFHNYCGLGAMDKDNPGCQFETEQMGVRAHIQHLQAYATTADIALNNELVDPRYSWVHKTKYIQTIFELTGTWAMDPEYGNKIDSILTAMEDYIQYS